MKINASSVQWLLAEFVVVVIGILVALAVDDYRNQRSAIETERFLLTELRDDLMLDLEELAQITGDAKRRQAAGLIIRTSIDPDSDRNVRGADTISLAQEISPLIAIRILGNSLDFDVTRRTFNQMDQLETFKTIQNRALGQSIVNYYSSIAGQNLIVETEVRHRLRLLTLLEQSGIARFDQIDDDHIIEVIRQNPELAALIRNTEFHAGILRRDFERFDQLAKDLVLQLDEYLND